MATTNSLPASAARSGDAVSLTKTLAWVLSPLASLKLTVTLFAFSIALILVGTLAQEDQDMWAVKRDFFESPFAWVPFQVFAPDAFALSLVGRPVTIPGGFYMPGGVTIGVLLMLNLLSAHMIRFRIQAKGRRLWAGLGVLLFGGLITWLVVEGGHNREGVQGEPLLAWSTLWLVFKLSLVGLWFLSVYSLFQQKQGQTVERWALLAASVLLGALILFLLLKGDAAQLSAASMRILWQLLQGTFAGVALLAGCLLLFKKRAGIVVIHGGIGLLMFSEFFVSMYAVEERMSIQEGEAVNYTQDIRFTELAIVDPSADPDFDDVVAVPEWMLLDSLRTGERISHPELPIDVQVVKYFRNSRLDDVQPDFENPANAGVGLSTRAKEMAVSSGASADSQVDLASAYIALYEKGGDKLFGTHLVSLLLSLQDYAEKVQVGDKEYQMFLRFKRAYQPYTIRLVDVRRDDYMGTDTPKNYSSDVRIVDETRNIDMEKKIWMNNPLRYAGQTFYQSGYQVSGGTEITDLQVVTNTGWMIPYVSCMIVAVGMFYHFGGTFKRFLRRRTEEEARYFLTVQEQTGGPGGPGGKAKGKPSKQPAAASGNAPLPPQSPLDFMRIGGGVAWAIAAVLVCLLAGSVLRKAVSDRPQAREMNIAAFGELPVMYQGRIKPFDTLARNMLRVISDRDYLVVGEGDSKQTLTATQWLLNVIAETKEAREHHIFRIDNPDVQQTLGLPRRKGHRYSVEEVAENFEEFERQVDAAKKLPADEVTVYQRRLLELDKRLQRYLLLTAAFRPQPFPKFPTEEEFQNDREATTRKLMVIKQLLDEVPARDEQLARMQPPLAVPGPDADTEWLTYASASNKAYVQEAVLREEANPFTLHLQGVLQAFRDRNRGEFNNRVAAYRAALQKTELVDQGKVDFESFYNRFAPFSSAMVFYILALVLSFFGLLTIGLAGFRPGAPRSFLASLPSSINRFVFLLIVATFALHSFALVSRIMISGRPPVTNLYSSAIFIGWAAVLLGIVLESLFRFSIGNILASNAGFATLLIAGKLTGDGDTMAVMQAVLDTQFWLATHVVSITFGYSTTFLAGWLGIIYIFCGLFTPALNSRINREFGRMIYAVLCFSLFFSFVGTVLGGLWADDSWGRFWGWDPKENGALIIVLWNALVLHARWGGMVKDRGLAVLAIGGNIATSWSWFGVNELGVGLHSYGFTEGVIFALTLFVFSQLAIIGLGLLPRQCWWSFRRNGLV